MTVLKDISLEAKNLAAIFEATGAEVVEMDFLQISNLSSGFFFVIFYYAFK